MSYMDVYIAERLMERNVVEGAREAEIQRLAQQLQPERQGILIRVGRLLQRLSQQLERYGPPAAPEIQQEAGRN
jgi:hypothetical protein